MGVIKKPQSSPIYSNDFVRRASGQVTVIRHTQAGFTLIELLVAATLLSIVLGAVYSAFFLSHRAMEGMDTSVLKLQECRMVMDIMGREIESLWWNSRNKNAILKAEDRDFFGRQTSRFAFNSFSSILPGPAIISYSVEEIEGGLVLCKQVNSAAIPASEVRTVEMLEDIESFTVEVKSGEKWVRTWNTSETEEIPEEIRISLMVRMNDRPFFLYQTFRPRIGKAFWLKQGSQ